MQKKEYQPDSGKMTILKKNKIQKRGVTNLHKCQLFSPITFPENYDFCYLYEQDTICQHFLQIYF